MNIIPFQRKKIGDIQFSIMSDERKRAISVMKLENSSVIEKGVPKPGGLADTLLGTTTRNLACSNCGYGMSDCPAHYCHLEFAMDIFNPCYFKDIEEIAQKICFECAEILIKLSPGKIQKMLNEYSAIQRRDLISEMLKLKPKTCPHCNTEVFKVKMDNGYLCRNGKHVHATVVKTLFTKLKDVDIDLLGYSSVMARPQDMIMGTLIVPPPAVRPTVITDDSCRGDDDLTRRLIEIHKLNATLFDLLEADNAAEYQLKDAYANLCNAVASYMLSDKHAVMKTTRRKKVNRNSRKLKSIESTIKSKEGEVRNHLGGKRNNRSARSVITPDPDLKLFQLGVPSAIAHTLTYEEPVNIYNRKMLQKIVDLGADHPHGAEVLRKLDGTEIDLKDAPAFLKTVEIGDSVFRFMTDGDNGAFNRQPSLHKMSMMGHEIKVLDQMTFSFNTSVTTPYNADHDGDEMNLHVSEDINIKTEIRHIMNVTNNIVSPQGNRPVIGIVQDSTLGLFLLTDPTVKLSKNHVMRLCNHIPKFDLKIFENPGGYNSDGRPFWTGSQIVSLALPRINVRIGGVVIENGILKSGQLTKKVLGCVEHGLVHIMANDLGGMVCAEHIFILQKIASEYLMIRGATVGISDVTPSDETYREIRKLMKEYLEKAQTAARVGTKVAWKRFYNILDEATTMSGQIALKFMSGNSNGLKNEIESGAKGTLLNQTQTIATLGMQHINGGPVKINKNDRMLPHFTFDSTEPRSRGYVDNSFIHGIHPAEYWFHAMAGRTGLIDTAVGTSESGYLQRRLAKSMCDLRVMTDGTVRNSQGQIFQFRYGSNGFDAVHEEHQYLQKVDAPLEEFEKYYKHDSPSPILAREYEALLNARDRLGRCGLSKTVVMPVPVERMILNVRQKMDNAQKGFMNCLKRSRSEVGQVEREEIIEDLCVEEEIVKLTEKLFDKIMDHGEPEHSTFLDTLHILLASKPLVEIKKVDLDFVRILLDKIFYEYEHALVQGGEAVGSLASQSMGEPSTQMTLNTFHTTGSVNLTVSMGVPRMKEILNCAKKIKTPIMRIALKPPYNTQHFAERFARMYRCFTIANLVSHFQMICEPQCDQTVIEEDAQWLAEHYAMNTVPKTFSWVVVRIILSRQELLQSGWTVRCLLRILCERYPTVHFVGTPTSESVDVIRFRIPSNISLDDQLVSRKLYESVLQESLGGIEGITEAFADEQTITFHDREKGLVTQTEWIIITHGRNLPAMVMRQEVDVKKIYCNDLKHVAQTFGLEKGRSVLYNELTALLTSDGTQHLNPHHVMLLVDTMCRRGSFMPITRHGINRSETYSSLHQCSFEEQGDMIIKAARHGLKNNVNGVVDNLLLAQTIPIGTSYSEIIVDWDGLKKLIPRPIPKTVPNAMEIFSNDLWFPQLSSEIEMKRKKSFHDDNSLREDTFHSKSVPFAKRKSPDDFNQPTKKMCINIMDDSD